MTTVLYADEWVAFTVDAKRGLVRYERTERPYGAEDIERSYAGVAEAVSRVPPGMKLLIDVRRAPPRNDAAFEARANGALDQLVKRFTRHATLVRTAVGKLQSVRLASERGAVPHVFENEAEALTYLAVAAD
jgi:hypothetical protein